MTKPLSSSSSSSSLASSSASSMSSSSSTSSIELFDAECVETGQEQRGWRHAEKLALGLIEMAQTNFQGFEAFVQTTAEINYVLFERIGVCIEECEENIEKPLFDRMQQCFKRISHPYLHPTPYLHRLTTFRTNVLPLALQDTNFIPRAVTGVSFVAEELVAETIESSKEELEKTAKSLSNGDPENPSPTAKKIIKNEIISEISKKISLPPHLLQKLNDTGIGDVIEEQIESFFAQGAWNV
jgi:hypothetical protein